MNIILIFVVKDGGIVVISLLTGSGASRRECALWFEYLVYGSFMFITVLAGVSLLYFILAISLCCSY